MMPRINISDERFIAIWNAAKRRVDAARQLGVRAKWAGDRARDLRNQGHKLKCFRNQRTWAPIEKRTDYSFSPTFFAPGTKEKLDVLQQRVTNGSPLWHPDDADCETAINRTPLSQSKKSTGYLPKTATIARSRKWIEET